MASTQGEVVISESELPTLLLKAGANFAKRHYVLSGSWIIGLLICFFAQGFTPDPAAVQQYEAKLNNLNIEELLVAEDNMWRWQDTYQRSKGWFFQCDQQCQYNYERFRESEQKFSQLKAEYEQGVSNAKAEVGLLSNYAEEETRDLFWGMFARGKGFAKRMTMWDAIFFGLQSIGRDEHILSYILRVVIQMLFNFTMGLIGAFLGFLWNLWGLITSYQPDFLTGLFFFAVAGLAGWAFVTTWLVGLYVGTAGTVYVAGKALLANARIEYRDARGAQGRYMGPQGVQYPEYARHQSAHQQQHYRYD